MTDPRQTAEPQFIPYADTPKATTITGEIVDELSTDQLIDDFERYVAEERAAQAGKMMVAAELARRAERDIASKTSRVRGERRRIKIEWPDDAWDQSQLKEAWHAFPDLRDEFLAISQLRVRIREYNKMLREHGPEQFEMFKNLVKAANKGPQGNPRIIIEE